MFCELSPLLAVTQTSAISEPYLEDVYAVFRHAPDVQPGANANGQAD